MAGSSDGAQAGTGNYRPHEMLALEHEVAQLRPFLEAQHLVGLTEVEPDPVGIVRFHWTSDQDPGHVVDVLRQRCDAEWKGWRPTVSPNHVLGRVVDPDTAELVGAGEDYGGPASPAQPTDDRLAERRGKDDAGTGVTIGVLDGGIMAHPWLAGSYLATPADFDVESQQRPGQLDPQDGHGTFVAGIILQQAPGATIRVVRKLGSAGGASVQEVANGIQQLGEMGVDVINLSLGGYTRNNGDMAILGQALCRLSPTTVVVAAAGNHNPNVHRSFRPARKFWPAAFPDVVSVAALGPNGDGHPTLADFSNYGQWVTLSTYGTDVLSTYLEFGDTFHGWARWSGTSFAAPRVAGAIAARMTEGGTRVRSAQEAKRMLLDEVQGAPFSGERIAETDDPGPGPYVVLPSAIKTVRAPATSAV